MKISAIARIYFPSTIELGAALSLSPEQSHYLINVLRFKNGDKVRIFNEASGEYIASANILSKKSCELEVIEFFRQSNHLPTLCLAQCIIKGDRMMQIIDIATQLGVTEIKPIISSRTQIRTINEDRYRKCLIESSEQSERLSIPALSSPVNLEHFLRHNEFDKIFYANEMERNNHRLTEESVEGASKIAVVIGPEGGFTDEEVVLMAKFTNAYSISLGPNVLRAETAAAALLAQIQLMRKI